MMRLLCVTTLTATLAACQTAGPGPDNRDELTRLVEYHQALEQRDDVTLVVEAEQLRQLLQVSGNEATAAQHLRLLILETRMQLRELRQIHDQQLQQIESLNTQIEALTAIEQQINRRGQLQETVNE